MMRPEDSKLPQMGVLESEEPPILLDNGVFDCESVERRSLATNDNWGTKGFQRGGAMPRRTLGEQPMHEAHPIDVSPMVNYGGMMDIFSTNPSCLMKTLYTAMSEVLLSGCNHIANNYLLRQDALVSNVDLYLIRLSRN